MGRLGGRWGVPCGVSLQLILYQGNGDVYTVRLKSYSDRFLTGEQTYLFRPCLCARVYCTHNMDASVQVKENNSVGISLPHVDGSGQTNYKVLLGTRFVTNVLEI
jgi:hypothetical protein